MKDIENTLLKVCKDIGVYPNMKDCFSIHYTRHFRQAKIRIYFNFIINSKYSIDDTECFIGSNLDEVKKELIDFFYDPTQIKRIKQLYEKNKHKISHDWK